MENPNEDTEWNDVLRHHGVLPPKKEAEITEEQLGEMVDQTIREKQSGGKKSLDSMGLDELDELEDEEDERVMLEYRKKRMAEMKLTQERNQFGELIEITGSEYVQQVNKAGDGVWVILHLYKQGLALGKIRGFVGKSPFHVMMVTIVKTGHFCRIPLCSLINRYLTNLAKRFPATKFLRSISTTCIPNFPDSNLPTVFVYCQEDLKGQIVGPLAFGGMKLTQDELEWKLSEIGAVQTELEENPWKKRQIHDVMKSSVRDTRREEDSDDDD